MSEPRGDPCLGDMAIVLFREHTCPGLSQPDVHFLVQGLPQVADSLIGIVRWVKRWWRLDDKLVLHGPDWVPVFQNRKSSVLQKRLSDRAGALGTHHRQGFLTGHRLNLSEPFLQIGHSLSKLLMISRIRKFRAHRHRRPGPSGLPDGLMLG